jgi:hypothetical protein
MRYVETLGGLVLHPKTYISLIYHERRSFIEGLFTVVLSETFLGIIAASILYKILVQVVSMFKGVVGFGSIFAFLSVQVLVPIFIVQGLLAWFIWAGMTHIFAKLLGGGGEFEPLLVVYGYNWFTEFIVILPLLFFPLAPVASVLSALVFMLLRLVWMIYLNFLGVREVHGLSSGRSLLSVLLLPLLILLVVASLPALVFLAMGGVA